MSALPFAFGAPWYLVCLLALPAVFLFSRHSLAGLPPVRRAATILLRSLVLILVIFALAEFRWRKTNDRLAVIFVSDLSESIPAEQREAERQYMLAKAEEREPDDRVGVVAFGKVPGIEWSPKDAPLELESFTTLIEPQATDIAAAIRLATAVFPEGYGKRIVLLSDGNENVGAVLEEVYNARAQGVTVDVVPISYQYPTEISLEKLLIEPEQNVGEPFDIKVVVNSIRSTEANLQLFENGRLVPWGEPQVSLKKGKNVFEFRGRRVNSVGLYRYEARIEPLNPDDDHIYQNNTAFGFTFIGGEPKILVCTSDPGKERPLVTALRNESITLDVATPETLPGSIGEYLQYDAIVLSNVSADRVSPDTMKMFESLVKTIGLGFVMIGGENSFGAGGYQGTPVERLLPVEMDIKNKKIMPNGALAMVVHSCELGNGNLWARRVIQQAVRILSPRDFAGVIYYERGTDRWLFPDPGDTGLWRVARRREMLGRLNNFSPGDMLSFVSIMTMARDRLIATPAHIKHMIVLSDGDPQPPSVGLVNTIRQAGITVSTICYGAHGTVPAGMRALAQQGGGRFYYLQSPRNLPEIFIRETTTVTKSLINEEDFIPMARLSHPILQGIGAESAPVLHGYVLTTAKELASVPMVHPPSAEDPTADPLLAAWSYGLGKSVAFTSDAGQRWGTEWASWAGFRRFWGQCIRWVMRLRSSDRFRVTPSFHRGQGIVRLDAFTPDGAFADGLEFEATVVSPDFETEKMSVNQTAPGGYIGKFRPSKKGTYTVSLVYEKDGVKHNFVTGLSLPYSAEYRRLETDAELLAKVATAGGGTFFEDPVAANFFARDFPLTHDVQDVWEALLTAALCLFFLDVFVRRVVIDYRKALRTAWGRARAFVTMRQPEVAPADARLATLLERKAKLREAAGSRYRRQTGRAETPRGSGGARETGRATTDSPPGAAVGVEPEGSTMGGLLSEFDDGGAPRDDISDDTSDGGRVADRGKKSDKRQRVESDDQPVAGSYTARLLEAKKRALREKRDSEQSS